jgi:hypothetical protein
MVQSALVAGRRHVTTAPPRVAFRPECEDAHSPEIPGRTVQWGLAVGPSIDTAATHNAAVIRTKGPPRG